MGSGNPYTGLSPATTCRAPPARPTRSSGRWAGPTPRASSRATMARAGRRVARKSPATSLWTMGRGRSAFVGHTDGQTDRRMGARVCLRVMQQGRESVAWLGFLGCKNGGCGFFPYVHVCGQVASSPTFLLNARPRLLDGAAKSPPHALVPWFLFCCCLCLCFLLFPCFGWLWA